MMNKLNEYRLLEQKIEVRAAKADGFIGSMSGYAALFGVESRDFGGWREVIQRGAFSSSLSRNIDVRMLWQHKPDQVMARMAAGNLKIEEDEKGLRFEADLVDCTINRDALAAVRSGNVDAMSFGMPTASRAVSWTRRASGGDLCTVRSADVVEISVVTWAAYEQTAVSTREFQIFREQSLHTSMPISVIRSRLELEKLKRQ